MNLEIVYLRKHMNILNMVLEKNSTSLLRSYIMVIEKL
jgi:hypothetical protein